MRKTIKDRRMLILEKFFGNTECLPFYFLNFIVIL